MKSKLFAALLAATTMASGADAATYIFTIAPILGTNGQPLRGQDGSGDGRTFNFSIGDTETPTTGLPFAYPNYRVKSYSYTEFGSTTPVVVPATVGKNVVFFDSINQGGVSLTNSGNRNFRLLNTVLFDEAAYKLAILTNPSAQPVFSLGTFALSTTPWNQTPINPRPRPLDNYTVTIALAGAVPEPATWAMMIGGFGLVGGALRRRATAVTFA